MRVPLAPARTGLSLLTAMLLVDGSARASIIATGHVDPPYNLPDIPEALTDITADRPVIIGTDAPGTLTIDNGWSLTAPYSIITNTTNVGFGQPLLSVTDHSALHLQYDLDVGNVASGRASFSAFSVATMRAMRLGTQTGAAGQLDFQGSTLTCHDITVGVAGSGEAILAGSTVQTTFITLGDAVSAAGFLTLNGSTLDNTEGLIVGYRGGGVLNVEGGSVVQTGFLEMSRFATTGTFNLLSGAHLTVRPAGGVTVPSVIFATEAGSSAAGTIDGTNTRLDATGAGAFFEVARHGDATVAVSGGARADVGYALIGTESDGDGSLSVSDVGTRLAVNGDLEVGRNGHGIFDVTSGASATTSGTLFVAAAAGGTGGLGLGGDESGSPRSSITAGGQAIVGYAGTGSMMIADGATLTSHKSVSPTSSAGIIGQNVGSVGNVSIVGSGSTWDCADGALSVGYRGSGTLSIQQGARVRSTDGTIGRLAGSSGNVTIGGSGGGEPARWLLAGSLYVGGRPASAASGAEGQAGAGGGATLTVNAGGFVSVANELHLFPGSTVDLSGGGSIGVASASAAESSTLHVFGGGSLVLGGTLKGDLRTAGTVAATITSPSLLDQLMIDGSATLGGTLSLSTPATLSLSAGQRIDLITASAVTGRFAAVTGGKIDSTHWLAAYYGASKVSLGLAGAGDATLDGAVRFDDLLTLAKHYNQSGPTIDWTSGDFDGNNAVTFSDLLALAKRYGQAGATGTADAAFMADFALAQSLVPEPATAVATGVLSMAFACRRRTASAGDAGHRLNG